MERYNRLLTLDCPQWEKECPVMLEKGALLKDNLICQNILQLQFKNIVTKSIVALNIEVQCCSKMDSKILEKVGQEYLDLNISCGNVFGANIPIVLSKDNTRKFTIIVKNVIFEDDTVYKQEIILSKIMESTSLYKMGSLQKFYLAELKEKGIDVDVMAIPKQYDNYWYCTCGMMNDSDNEKCIACNSQLADLMIAANETNLIEKQKAEKERLEKQNDEKKKSRLKKAKKIAFVAVIIVIVVAVISIIKEMNIIDKYEFEKRYRNTVEQCEMIADSFNLSSDEIQVKKLDNGYQSVNIAVKEELSKDDLEDIENQINNIGYIIQITYNK